MDILGWMANLLFFSGGIVKNTRTAMSNYVVADGLYVIMYFSSGLLVPAFSMLFAGLRTVLAIFLNEKQNLISVIALTIMTSIIVILNMTHTADTLILLAGLCIGLSCYYRDSVILFRLAVSGSQILWIAHSVIFSVYPMIFCCCLILATNIYALYAHTDLFKKLRYARITARMT